MGILNRFQEFPYNFPTSFHLNNLMLALYRPIISDELSVMDVCCWIIILRTFV